MCNLFFSTIPVVERRGIVVLSTSPWHATGWGSIPARIRHVGVDIWARLQGSDVGFVGTKTLRPDWQVSVRANCY